MRLGLALLCAVVLASCSETRIVVMPPLVEYTEAERLQLADEMEAAPETAVWPRMIVDYRVLRAQIRAAPP